METNVMNGNSVSIGLSRHGLSLALIDASVEWTGVAVV